MSVLAVLWPWAADRSGGPRCSPFFRQVARPEDLIEPAVRGTLNVLRACAKEPTVERVVVTSSFAAVVFGHDQNVDPSPFTESDWNTVSSAAHKEPMHWYRASKVQAERACWDFLEAERPSFSIVTINPPMIVGPWLPHYKRPNESSMVVKEKLCGGCGRRSQAGRALVEAHLPLAPPSPCRGA